MINSSIISQACIEIIDKVGINDSFEKGFIQRAYREGDLSAYIERLHGIDFTGLDLILDSGCGYGQWSVALSSLNNEIIATDVDPLRIEFCNLLFEKLNIRNTKFQVKSMTCIDEQLEGSFDAIFSYAAVPLTDFKKTLEIFYSLLKENGKLYFSSYDLGWMLYNIENDHGKSRNYNSKDSAIKCIENTVDYFHSGDFHQESFYGMYIPQKIMIKELVKTGFTDIKIAGDGEIINKEGRGKYPFFISNYNTYPAVYDVLCSK